MPASSSSASWYLVSTIYCSVDLKSKLDVKPTKMVSEYANANPSLYLVVKPPHVSQENEKGPTTDEYFNGCPAQSSRTH